MIKEHMEISGLKILNKIYESQYVRIFKAEQKKDQKQFVLKTLKKESFSRLEAIRLHYEFSITSEIDSDFIIKIYDIIHKDELVALKIEDFQANSLSYWLKHQPPSLEQGLEIAVAICKGLEALHQSNVIHNDISSANILWNPDTKAVKIIDFGMASRLDQGTASMHSSNNLEGTFYYMSPEQTGQMNHGVDYRTDLYSLGVTLYELFTGSLPFQSDDLHELFYAHLASIPYDPTLINNRLPGILGKLIMKLLEKNADDRYQSAFGVQYDLEQMLSMLKSKDKILTFDLARRDKGDKFIISSKLYGREKAVNELYKSFKQVCEGQVKLTLVRGYSGVGKSVLVQELYRPLIIAKGRYITGKFDQYQRNIPYSAIADAFNRLCQQLKLESKGKQIQIKKKLLAAFGPNGQALIDIIPELETLIGKQPPLQPVNPQAEKNRFNQQVINFLSQLCDRASPLVLFLDDLQWADQSSLDLIQLIITNTDLQGLHLIGAYRDNEVSQSHPLMLTLAEIDKSGFFQQNIQLTNLSKQDVLSLVTDTLRCDKQKAQQLAKIIYEKTQGNAFFTTEFIKNLYKEGLLYYSQGDWIWDSTKIHQKSLSSNVIDFMTEKVKKFNNRTQYALKYAACIGNKFDINTLLTIAYNNQPSKNLTKDIYPAIQQGIIIPLSDFYEYKDNHTNTIFKFRHDRIQQAAYSLTAEADRPEIHYEIGCLLYKKYKNHGLQSHLFEIITHLNKGLSIAKSRYQQFLLIKLNYLAGIKAKSASAYSASVDYLRTAKTLLPENAFSRFYKQTFHLHIELAKSLYTTGAFQEADKLYPLLIGKAANKIDEVKVRLVQMDDCHLQGQYDQAIVKQKKGLALLGLSMPEDDKDIETEIKSKINTIKQILEERSSHQLLEAPKVDSQATILKLKLLVGMWMSAYLASDDNVVQWCSVQLMQTTLDKGNSEYAAFAYVQYAYLCVLRLKQYKQAFGYGKLAIKLADRYANIEMCGKVYNTFAGFVSHWNEHIDKSIQYSRQAYKMSVESGDWTYAAYAASNLISSMLIAGNHCDDVKKEAQEYFKFLKGKADTALKSFFLPGGYCPLLNFLGETDHYDTYDCEHLDEQELLQTLGKQFIVQGWYYSAKIRSLFYYRIFDENMIKKPDIVAKGVPAQVRIPEANFFSCLMISALYCAENSAEKRRTYWKYFNQYADEITHWSEHCTDNLLHKHLLLQAEKYKMLDADASKIITLYNQSKNEAKNSGYINNAGLAMELKGRYRIDIGQADDGLVDIKEAYKQYSQWGVHGKLTQLLREFPELKSQLGKDGKISANETASLSNYHLDLSSIYKATQAISRKVKWHELIESILKIMIETVGATSGLLLYKNNDEWFPMARGFINKSSNKIRVIQTTDEQFPNVITYPNSVIQYTDNINTLLIENALTFKKQTSQQDPYFENNQHLSMICMPVLTKQHKKIILYLENNLSSDAFSIKREKTLSILRSQIIISLENSLLYKKIEGELATKITQLERANKELKQFTYIASHDLQSPLNSIIGFSDLLQRQIDDPDSRANNYANRIGGAAQRMRLLIDDLLDYSRATSTQYEFEEVDLNQVYQNVVSNFSDIIETTNADMSADHLPVIMGAKTQLEQLFQNLISNALKYRQCKKRPHIHIPSKQEKDQYHIAFKDNGIGIESEYFKQIFEPFKRLHDSSTYEGTGIGLSVCQKIVEHHKGHIKVESQPNQGSTFTVTLPKEATLD